MAQRPVVVMAALGSITDGSAAESYSTMQSDADDRQALLTCMPWRSVHGARL